MQHTLRHPRPRKRRARNIFVFFVFLVLSVVAFSLVYHDRDQSVSAPPAYQASEQSVPQQDFPEEIASASSDQSPTMPEISSGIESISLDLPTIYGPQMPDGPYTVQRVVNAGDTAGSILRGWLSLREIQAFSDACEDVFTMRRLRPGQPYTLTIEKGVLISFEYEIDQERKLIISRDEEGLFIARGEDIFYDVLLERVEGVITSNLFQTVADAGEGPALAIALADIYAWEINFIRDIQPGDSFVLIVEKRFRDGEFKGYGKIQTARFINNKTTFEAFLFQDPEGRPEYFTSNGESLKRAFLKAPLSFTRISSTFTNARLHPIHKVWRAHPGIDYAAPTGTPVKAVGNGTVTFSGWGKGAGNYIAVRHKNGYETMYLHLSAFAKGLKKGLNVQQGDVIGYVGSTGYSTGPHLDFRMKKNGVYVNPLHELTPRSEPVAQKDMPEFTRRVTVWREYINGGKDPLLFPPEFEKAA